MMMEQSNKLIEKDGYVYAPYIPVTTGTIINGIKVWDHRWYVNIFCKIRWFFHFKERRRWKEIANKEIKNVYLENIKTIYEN